VTSQYSLLWQHDQITTANVGLDDTFAHGKRCWSRIQHEAVRHVLLATVSSLG